MLVECLDDVIVQFVGPGHNPLRVRIKSTLDVVIHVDQGEQLARSRAPRVLRRSRRQIGRKRMALVVLNDADDRPAP